MGEYFGSSLVLEQLGYERGTFCCGSLLPVFGIRVYVCSYYFSSFWVAEWPPFWEIAAHSVDYMFSLYFDYL